MSVADSALAMMFSNPIMARDATWYEGGVGAGAPVRIITRQPDTTTGFGAAQVWSDTMVADIRVTDAPTLAEGDTFDIGGDSYTVQGEPKRDREKLSWTMDLVPT